MKHSLLLALAVLAAGQALAQGAAAERERIHAERSAADARYAQEQKACRAKFAVNDCLADVRREHNAVVSRLRRQERVLDEADRRRRAAERLRELELRRAAQPPAAAAAGQAEAAARQPRQAPAPQGTPRAPRKREAHRGNAPTAQEAARNRAAYEQKREEAERHKAAVAERAAKRGKARAADLPDPTP